MWRCCFFFFFSSRRRHTRCALVTGVQTCALPISSNGTRELSDALRRRCLYHFVDYPTEDKEARILTTRLPQVDATLALQIAAFVASVRKEDLRKVPGVAETLDWAAALVRSEEHTSELQSLMRTSYAVFCLKK